MFFLFATKLNRVISERSNLGVVSFWWNHATRLVGDMALAISVIDTMAVYVSQGELSGKRSGTEERKKMWHHQNRTWFIPSGVRVCVHLYSFGSHGNKNIDMVTRVRVDIKLNREVKPVLTTVTFNLLNISRIRWPTTLHPGDVAYVVPITEPLELS